jgi:uncharacterized RDD family membrane protein YckC
MKGWIIMKTTLIKDVLAMLLAGGLAWNCAALAPVHPAEPAGDAPAAPTAPEKTEPALEEPAGANVTVTVGKETSISVGGDRGPRSGEVVKINRDFTLKSGENAELIVVIGGSAKVEGSVNDVVVAILGDVEVVGKVGGEVISVLGNVKAGEGARIGGDVISVGGKIDTAEGAEIGGMKNEVDFSFGNVDWTWLKNWFFQCVIKMRPLALQVGWIWWFPAIFILFYLLVAAVFPRPIASCVGELNSRPTTSFLMGVLTLLLLPVVLALLIATGFGVLVVPFLFAALAIGGLAGKVALLEWVGFKVGKAFGPDVIIMPVFALFLGAAVITVLYLVPVLGMLIFAVIGVWGLGSAVLATFGGLRREMPERTPPPSTPGPNLNPNPASPQPAASSTVGPAEPNLGDPQAATTQAIPPVFDTPMPEAIAFPKAGFWERMGAGFLDLVLVGIVGAMVGGPPLAFLVWLAYFAGMWTWKGTTVGGIVLGLKVVRMDGKPVTFAVGLVRALGGAFSIMVIFLGILWIAWDREKQGWHDKLAGTVVLKQPRGTPLVCL